MRHHPVSDRPEGRTKRRGQAAIGQHPEIAVHVVGHDRPAGRRNPALRLLHDPGRDPVGLAARVGLANGLDQCDAPLNPGAKRTKTRLQPRSEILAPGASGTGRDVGFGGNRCHRSLGRGRRARSRRWEKPLSPSRCVKYIMALHFGTGCEGFRRQPRPLERGGIGVSCRTAAPGVRLQIATSEFPADTQAPDARGETGNIP